MRLRTLLVDNHDSYTFNLFQLIAAVNGTEPDVVTNDGPLLARLSAGAFDNVVISPGPGRPQCPRDVGFLADLLRHTELPVLGVCLGHQVIAYQAGARVGPAPQPRHGHLSQIEHHGDDLFAGIPAKFTGVRYHSLCVDRATLPAELLVSAVSEEDGVVMGLRHATLPLEGVQFHPESVLTPQGPHLLANFLRLAGEGEAGRLDAVAGSFATGGRAEPASGPATGPTPGPDR